jgi:hypothetical protein
MDAHRTSTTGGQKEEDSKKRKKCENGNTFGNNCSSDDCEERESKKSSVISDANNSDQENDLKTAYTKLFHDVLCESNMSSWYLLLLRESNKNNLVSSLLQRVEVSKYYYTQSKFSPIGTHWTCYCQCPWMEIALPRSTAGVTNLA